MANPLKQILIFITVKYSQLLLMSSQLVCLAMTWRNWERNGYYTNPVLKGTNLVIYSKYVIKT
jgi:hypothetical protein